MKKIFTIAVLFCGFFANSQNCYTTIINATGIDLSYAQQDLESNACNLSDLVDTIFNIQQNGQFKVFCAHLYLHISALKESEREQHINMIKSQCDQSSPYYLAIITETYSDGLFQNFHIIVKLPNQAQIPCLNSAFTMQIEEKVRQAIIRNYGNGIFPLPDAICLGIKKLSNILVELNQNNCCVLSDYEIINMFTQNGFKGIPIKIEPFFVSKPEFQYRSNNLHDFANIIFKLDGQIIDFSLLEFQGISTEVIVSCNQNICENDGSAYEEANNIFNTSSDVCWYHIWKSPDSLNSDFLLVKFKPFGGYTETVPKNVAYIKRIEKEVVKYKPLDEPDDIPPIIIEYSFPVYGFSISASLLLSNLAEVVFPNSFDEIRNVEIRNNRGGVLPAYSLSSGGGGMTFPWFKNRYQAVIQYTANYFATSGFTCCNYGNDPNAWLGISAHEVIHIKHIRECDCDTWAYFGSFLWEYTSNFGHNTAPMEIEADIGWNRYNNFNSWLWLKKGTSVSKLFNSTMDDYQRSLKILELWNEFPNK